MHRYISVIEKISEWFGKCAGWLCLILVVLTVEQVLARYILGKPSNGLEELKWHLFGTVFLFGLAFAYKHDSHVRVDIFSSRFPEKPKATIALVGNVFFVLPLCFSLIWHGVGMTVDTYLWESGVPHDHWVAKYFGEGSTLYQLLQPIEGFLRETIIHGERSDTEGGLEARYLIKAVIPLSFLILFLQTLFLCIESTQKIFRQNQ